MIRKRFALSLADAEPAMLAGLAEAREQNWAVTIAIVDDAGHLLHLSRMDEASPISVNVAIEKARSAGLSGIESKIMEAVVRERPGVATAGWVAIEGGVPILYQRQRVGGIGVSGVQSHQDSQVAFAARAALPWASE